MLDPRRQATPAAKCEPAVGMYWSVRPSQRRRGYATEAASALADWALANLNLSRIVAGTDRGNTASVGVMRAMGMTIEANPFAQPAWFQILGILESRRRETSNG